jgi:prevent-host-death family protein
VTNKPVTELIDALSARTRFGNLLNRVEKENVRFIVSRKGKPMVVILGIGDYLKNVVKEPDLLARLQLNVKHSAGKTTPEDER